MRAAGFFVLVLSAACSGEPKPAPKTADNTAPIHEAQPLPTGSAPEPIPTVTATVAPLPMQPKATASSTGSTASTKSGPLSRDECGKVVHKFAENVATDKNADLMEGFQNSPIYQSMVDLCVQQTTRAQYDCAIASKTMSKWQECMK